ncbi:relaxase/mobilization nuclease domain-containing protein [Paenarthrobacter sp. PH39-S1]|uniref:relaxase/mobilization nuclease domain-containing protein n=1 Tax=Paenarthrobacter sp. PH39-S1 TaxID=3046204 RepID=UPI0024BA2980|nr:relaxase/mobilization nuclease domain-containing protein [Paenarthrobacter sp. PH39-S1]MDJ0356053.1 relaxase/mobilization nuclease domain-containing protein [Paenarthrobacter sp. PH39-S1]
MSTVNVRSSRDAAGAVNYVLFGNSRERRAELIETGQTRAAAFAISVAGDHGAAPAAFIERTEMMAAVHGRKVELQSYVLAFAPDEFDVTDPDDLKRVLDVAVKLAERMHTADYLIVVHADSAGGHGHAHILVANHDNLTGRSIQRYTSWKHGLRQLNDDLMRDEGLRVLPDPEQPKPDWELRREAFTPGGFEQTLGDKVYIALSDPRSVDQQAFEQVLEEHGITLAVTHRDGWSYKTRRSGNGKLGRKKASALTPEFTAGGAAGIFDIHQQNQQKGTTHGTRGSAPSGAAELDTVDSVGAVERRSHRRGERADEGRERAEGVSADRHRGDGQGRTAEGPAADLTALRQHVAADREHREQVERDREDAHRLLAQSRRKELQRRLEELDPRDAEEPAGHDIGD